MNVKESKKIEAIEFYLKATMVNIKEILKVINEIKGKKCSD